MFPHSPHPTLASPFPSHYPTLALVLHFTSHLSSSLYFSIFTLFVFAIYHLQSCLLSPPFSLSHLTYLPNNASSLGASFCPTLSPASFYPLLFTLKGSQSETLSVHFPQQCSLTCLVPPASADLHVSLVHQCPFKF